MHMDNQHAGILTGVLGSMDGRLHERVNFDLQNYTPMLQSHTEYVKISRQLCYKIVP